ncbi:MAG: NAD(P)H-dependent oxidoreductase [Magnetovibrio sp.]|nr:NAD(P)H-dependent oxidoreductase [Magnetovibrio sp.]
MKIIAFAASSSKSSINKTLVTYAAGLVENAEVEILDLNNFELPLFSVDKEAEIGQPDLAKDFLAKLNDCDAIMISFAEHDGSYSVAYKNLFDWCSRITRDIFQNKPMVILATSPGPGGAARVLKAATTSAPYFSGDVKASLSIPRFHDNFDPKTQTLNNTDLNNKLLKAVQTLQPSKEKAI